MSKLTWCLGPCGARQTPEEPDTYVSMITLCLADGSWSSMALQEEGGRVVVGNPTRNPFSFLSCVCSHYDWKYWKKKQRKLPLQWGRVNGENHGGLEALADMRYRMYSFQKYCHITMFLKKNQAGLLTCCSAAVCTLGPCGALQGGFFSLSHFPLTVQSKGKWKLGLPRQVRKGPFGFFVTLCICPGPCGARRALKNLKRHSTFEKKSTIQSSLWINRYHSNNGFFS